LGSHWFGISDLTGDEEHNENKSIQLSACITISLIGCQSLSFQLLRVIALIET
jgi:hypothetical protein